MAGLHFLNVKSVATIYFRFPKNVKTLKLVINRDFWWLRRVVRVLRDAKRASHQNPNPLKPPTQPPTYPRDISQNLDYPSRLLKIAINHQLLSFFILGEIVAQLKKKKS